jgi:hypothetical protein
MTSAACASKIALPGRRLFAMRRLSVATEHARGGAVERMTEYTALTPRSLTENPPFRIRGREISRVEGFSDAVFGFALTLLVVSLDVPRTFDELIGAMRGLVAFAISFALFVLIWYEHYTFFRRYGLQDTWTITLNAFLLFVVLFYVYPLKFLFSVFVTYFSGADINVRLPTGEIHPIIEQNELPFLFVIYGTGYMAVYVIFALLHRHAYRRREALALDDLEVYDTRAQIRRYLMLAGIGLLSIVTALVLPAQFAGLAGFVYFLVGIGEGVHGTRTDRRRKELAASLALH